MCPRTLVDRKRKRYDNAVAVVVRIHDRLILSTGRTAPPRSAHVQLGDIPRTHHPVELRGRASSARRRDDGDDEVYRRRASPKHRYDVTEVDYGGGGHRTRLREINDQLVCLWGAPFPRI